MCGCSHCMLSSPLHACTVLSLSLVCTGRHEPLTSKPTPGISLSLQINPLRLLQQEIVHNPSTPAPPRLCCRSPVAAALDTSTVCTRVMGSGGCGRQQQQQRQGWRAAAGAQKHICQQGQHTAGRLRMQLMLEQTQAEGVLRETQTRMCLPPTTLPAGSIEVAHYSAPALGRTTQTPGALLNRAGCSCGALVRGRHSGPSTDSLSLVPWGKILPPLGPAVANRDTPWCSILSRLARTRIE